MSTKLRKVGLAAATAVAIAGMTVALPGAADARWGGWHGGWRGGGWGWGGVGLGLATGFAIAAPAPYYRGYYGYADPYYYGGYPYAYGYGYPAYGYALSLRIPSRILSVWRVLSVPSVLPQSLLPVLLIDSAHCALMFDRRGRLTVASVLCSAKLKAGRQGVLRPSAAPLLLQHDRRGGRCAAEKLTENIGTEPFRAGRIGAEVMTAGGQHQLGAACGA